MFSSRSLPLPVFSSLVLLLGSACSVRGYATKALADTFAASGTGYSSDEDPELVREAVPFALKTMEQTLPEQPQHVGLLTALASGFTSYAYAFVQQEADFSEDKDIARWRDLQRRARLLYLRARNYGLRGLDVTHPGASVAFSATGSEDARKKLLDGMTKADVPLLYWTAAAWTLAITDGKEDMALVGTLPFAEQLITRAFALDQDWDEGSLHEYFIAYDAQRPASEGGGVEKARQHFDRARSLSKNHKLGSLVTLAESVSVPAQNKAEFTQLLEQALATDVNLDPPHRLANVVAQRRARWLLSRTADLFAE